MLTRRRFLSLAGSTIASAALPLMLRAASSTGKRNLLFIAIDDLRPVMGCYGGKAITPNLDKFSKTAAAFDRHYVQWPVCGPSRAAMMSGLRPNTSKVYQNREAWDISKKPEQWPTMSRYFSDQGHKTFSFGKIYHGKGIGDGYGWSERPWQPPCGWTCYVNYKYDGKSRDGKTDWRPAYEMYDGSDSMHGDFQTATQAMETMERSKDKPFCVFAGFYKPHLPFVAPKSYWDLYEGKDIERLKPLERPDDCVDYAYKYSELHSYGDQDDTLFSFDNRPDNKQALDLTRAYYAAVSFIDAQVGRLLKKLDELGLAENTAVVVWGDHGFHLGDQARWAKHTQFETDMRSPLMVRLPGVKHKTGRLHNFAETIDIYPTICEYLRLSAPKHLEGDSLIPAMSGKDKIGKKAAFTEYSPVHKKHNHLMIYTVRTEGYRYIQWRNPKDNNKIVEQELYDLQESSVETKNVVKDSAYKDVLRKHQDLIGAEFNF